MFIHVAFFFFPYLLVNALPTGTPSYGFSFCSNGADNFSVWSILLGVYNPLVFFIFTCSCKSGQWYRGYVTLCSFLLRLDLNFR